MDMPNMSHLIHNLSWMLNASSKVDPGLVWRFKKNRDVDDTVFVVFVTLYLILICFGAAGNILVCLAVARKPAMRTARNLFIVNLAVSDMLLCLITMPLTLMEILTKYWPLGDDPAMCKLLGGLQSLSIFVSTISITAIALDRYLVIVYPTGRNIQKLGAVIIVVVIWVIALLLSSPMVYSRTLRRYDVLDETVAYCIEEWPLENGRSYYSLFSLICQYVLPIIAVTVAYSRICKKLHYRYVNSTASKRNANANANAATTATATATMTTTTMTTTTTTSIAEPAEPVKMDRKRERDDRRMKKTNSLLVSIAIIFGVSWLPLNIYNLVVDTWNPFGNNKEAMVITYAICHMMGMSSACSNPLLYGWLNDNFRKEFREILNYPSAACCFFGCAAGDQRQSAGVKRHRLQGGVLGRNGKCGNGPATLTSSLMPGDLTEVTSFSHVL